MITDRSGLRFLKNKNGIFLNRVCYYPLLTHFSGWNSL